MKSWQHTDIDNIGANAKEKKGKAKKAGCTIMEDNRAEQIEALQILTEFNERLVKNMKIIVKELSGERLDDTNNFLKGIIDAINWEVQVVNGTMTLLNEKEERVSKEILNGKIIVLSDAIASKEDNKMVEAFQSLIPEFEQLGKAAVESIA